MKSDAPLRAVQAGMYVSALSMLAGVAMGEEEKQRQYASLLPAARHFLAGLPVQLPEAWTEFTHQGEWQPQVLETLRALGLNRHMAFGMALQLAQVYPDKAESFVHESGGKIGLETADIDTLLSALARTEVAERAALIDGFIEHRLGQTREASTESECPKGGQSGGERSSVFLCHCSEDKEKVRSLYRRLQADGINVWIDEEAILPGQDWQLEIEKAVRTSGAVIVCLTKRTLEKRGYVQKEIKRVLDVAEECPDHTIFVIPVKLDPCEVPMRLARWQWVDLAAEDGYGKLLRSLAVAKCK